MKKYRLLLLPALLFAVFAAIYTIDPNRHYTARRLVEKSSHTADDHMLSSLNVTSFAQDRNQMVWIGTSAGINVFDGRKYIQFFHDAADSTALPDDYINCLHRDRSGRMWIGTQNGLARYEGGCRFRRFAIPSADENITHIGDCDGAGGVVASTQSASFVVGNDGSVRKVGKGRGVGRAGCFIADTAVMDKPRDIVSATFVDGDSNLWIGYHNAGYQILSDNIAAYRHANGNALARASATHDIVALASAGTHILAGSTLRLRTYDTRSTRLTDIPYSRLLGPDIRRGQYVTSIVPYGTNGAWLVGNRQIASLRIEGASVAVAGKAYAKASGAHVLGCGTRMGDCLYVPSNGGYIIRYRFGADCAESIKVGSQWLDDETQLAALPGGKLLLHMRNMHIATFDTATHVLTPIAVSRVENRGNIDPAFARVDSKGNVWLGTKRSGLYRLDMRRSRVSRMPFPADVHVQALIEDRKGQIWITTLKDAVCYRPQTGAVLMNSLVSSSLNQWNRQFFDNSICLSPDGGVVLGSSDGCIFLPQAMSVDGTLPADLSIYALDVKTAGGRVLALDDNIGDNSQYTLAYDENDVTLRFFYPNYARRSSLMYQYMLEGYDHGWHEPTYAGMARLANLPPGKYRFRLRLVSSPDLPPVAERTIGLTVKAAPWQSAAAWVLYLTLAAVLVGYANSLYLRMRAGRMRLEHERREHERERRMNQMNMSFFANISHEFRNPLTLIAGPLVHMRSDSSLPGSVQQSLGSVCISVNRMLRLIDQMLDFNQLETDALRLRVATVDAAAELNGMAAAFGESARVRGIGLEVCIGGGDYTMPLDTDKFEKILSNLFTNALKHTPDNGRIRISMTATGTACEGRRMEVEVFNSGSHISAERLDDVFKRYYQLADANAQHKYGWGTGIGLYYVRRLVGLHHGEITVGNVCGESAGVAFRFWLPMSGSAYHGDEVASEPVRTMQIPVHRNVPAGADCAEKNEKAAGACPTAKECDKEKNGHKVRPKILVVDDDVDVAAYIRSLFSDGYVVENRYSAEAALRDMADIRPDIVLSDVVMGQMSGFDFCRALKADLMWSHIPVVLITAKSDMEEQISGLRLGAMAYVTKPFDPDYLCALVGSQLDAVQRMRRRLGDSTSTDDIADALSDQDRHFMDELYAVMERRSAELELSVAAVCGDMLVSQSKFNYKIKQLTGDTPGVFFRKYKLNHAAQLLRSGRHTVSEVAVMTGFGTAAHFSVAFKKQFGVVPSEYS